jgi:fatty-acyl-CoA synthase
VLCANTAHIVADELQQRLGIPIINIVDGEYGEGLEGPDYETFLASGTDDLLDKPVEDENAPISLNYTSGTTGNPKGVLYTHRSAYLNALDAMLEIGVNSHRLPLTPPCFTKTAGVLPCDCRGGDAAPAAA